MRNSSVPARRRRPAGRLLLLYMVLMPFMSALAITERLPLPLLVMAIAAPWLILRRDGPSVLQAAQIDAGFVLALLLGCLAMLNSPLPLGAKNFNYALAMLVSYAMFCVLLRVWISHPHVRWRDIVSGAHACLLLLSIAILAEFYLASFHGKFLSDIIPYAHDDLNVADFVTSDFKRPRGFASEPGFSALAYECLWPLAAADFGRRRRGWGRHLFYAVGFGLLASAAAVASLAVAMAAVALMRANDRGRVLRIAGLVLVVALLLVTTEAGQEIVWTLFGRKFDFVTAALEADDSAGTLFQRILTYQAGLTLLMANPLGIGWGTLGESFATGIGLPGVGLLPGSGMVSLYLDVAVASGWLGAAAFIWFVGRRIRGSLRSRHPLAVYVGVAVTSVCVHHAFITEFQFPFIWFALAMSDRLLAESQETARRAGRANWAHV